MAPEDPALTRDTRGKAQVIYSAMFYKDFTFGFEQIIIFKHDILSI